MTIEAEVNLYPVTEESAHHPVQRFVNVLKSHGCEVARSALGSIVKGESATVFEALRIGYEQAAERSGCVLIIQASNICPL